MVNSNNYVTGRNFLLTCNPVSLEYYTDIKEYLCGLRGMQYYLCTEHHGQAQQHYHIFVQYQNTKKLVFERLHGCHVEKCFGSAQKNIAYCKCEDEGHRRAEVTATVIDEEGTPRLKGGNYTVGYLKELSDDDELPAVFYNTWKKVKRDNQVVRAKDYRKNIKVYWIQGPSGVGKTNKAIDLATEFEEVHDCGTDFIKFVNGFYLGTTTNSRVAIYDDFRDNHMSASEFINLIDYNKHWMNIKGDSVLNNYNLIIITSVQKFSRIFRNVDDEPRAQWERRVEVIDMFPPERAYVGGLPVGYHTDFNDFSYSVEDSSDNTHVVIN